MEAIAPTVTEVNPQMTIDDLYLALKLTCPNAPSRSQFYEWLRLTWCNKPTPRGGKKLPKRYEQYHLNRLMCFAKLRDAYGSLKLAQSALEAEMTNNPTPYFLED
jgi:hypothetical protein